MAKNKIEIDVRVDDKGTTKKVGLQAKKAGEGLDKLGTSAHTADRNLKGAAKASSNGTKNFSKMAQGMGGLVGVYASVAASVFAVSAAFEFLKRASDFNVLIQAQEQYASSTGSMLQSITKELQAASGGMLQFQEAAQAAAIGAAKGFSNSQLVSLVEGARKTSAALGRSFQDSFDRLIRGVSKAEPELLDELGITLRLDTATKKYAKSIGVAVKELTAYQRSIAVLNEVQEQLDKNFGSINVDEIVNPFNQLAATFDGIVKTVTQGVLPIFEGFANVINRSAISAIAVFGTLFVSVAKAALPVDDLKSSFQEMSEGIDNSLEASKAKLAELADEAKRAKITIAQVQSEGSLGAQKAATGFVERGSKSKILGKAAVAPASLNKADKANLAKALKSAEAQYKKHGKIVTGIFKGENIQRVRDFSSSMKMMETRTVSFGKKAEMVFKGMGVQAQKAGIIIKKSFVGAMGAAGKAVGGLGKAFNKVLGFAGFIGLITFAVQMVKELYYNFYDITSSILGFFDTILNSSIGRKIAGIIGPIATAFSMFTETVVGTFASGITLLLDLLAKGLKALNLDSMSEAVAGLGQGLQTTVDTVIAGTKVAAAEINKASTGESSNLKGLFQGSELGRTTKATEENRKVQQKATQTAKELAEAFDGVAKAAEGIAKELENPEKNLTAFDKKLVGARATLTAGFKGRIETLIESIAEGASSEEVDKAIKGLNKSLLKVGKVGTDALKGIASPDFFGGKITENNLEQLLYFITSAEYQAGALVSNTKDFDETITKVGQNLDTYFGSSTGVLQLEAQLVSITKKMGDIGPEFSTTVELLEKFEAATGKSKLELTEAVTRLADTFRELRATSHLLKMEELGLTNQTGLTKKANEEALALKRAQLAVSEKQLEIDILTQNIQTGNLGGDTLVEAQAKLVGLNSELIQLKQKSADTAYGISEIGKIGMTVGESLQSSMASAFDGLVQGTMTAKEAFASMAMSILQSLSKIITEMLVVKMLQAALGGTSFGTFLGIKPAGRYGGVFSAGDKAPGYRYGGISTMPGYAVGGVAKGSDAGYPVVLHGTEAVVPLPNGKSIPVDMKGAGQNNNVVVNVSVDNQGNGQTSTESQSGADAGQLGQAIARAVQQELQNQKRSGGILNPYGVA